jgi:hypothetical protein
MKIRFQILLILLTISLVGYGQVTVDNNNPSAGNFVGYVSGFPIIPLEIRNDNNADVEFWTNGTQWLRLNEDGRWFHNTPVTGSSTFRLRAVPGTNTGIRVGAVNNKATNIGLRSTADNATSDNVGILSEVDDDDA